MGYVRREENRVAYVLASLATHDNINKVWLYDSPDCICETLHAEFLALHPLI
jgi:hypothetical protein